jgi:hypothetical protein
MREMMMAAEQTEVNRIRMAAVISVASLLRVMLKGNARFSS